MIIVVFHFTMIIVVTGYYGFIRYFSEHSYGSLKAANTAADKYIKSKDKKDDGRYDF